MSNCSQIFLKNKIKYNQLEFVHEPGHRTNQAYPHGQHATCAQLLIQRETKKFSMFILRFEFILSSTCTTFYLSLNHLVQIQHQQRQQSQIIVAQSQKYTRYKVYHHSDIYGSLICIVHLCNVYSTPPKPNPATHSPEHFPYFIIQLLW